jgi:uncharacterized repeat protein (TIGR03806 family)
MVEGLRAQRAAAVSDCADARCARNPSTASRSPSPFRGGFARAIAAFTLLLTLPAVTTGTRVADSAIAEGLPPTLSAFGFFDGAPDRPSPLLIPYTLGTPLFSDYADKRRFIYLPPGTRMTAHGDGLVSFPVGAAIIKSFGYPQADGSYRTIETRLLLHRAEGWVALPYIWRADGSDADLRLAGGRQQVSYTTPSGQQQTISYAVPNRNQCKTCHELSQVVTPIGPKLRNLELSASHRPLVDGADWAAPRLPRWDDAAQPLASRARAYLDVNCAHCHNPRGSASNSGLFLEYERTEGMVTGIRKRPVAAGRGSGGLDYAIDPGHPDRSYLLYRLRSLDPGIAMPELGRASVHDEGVRLLEQWIAGMPAN